VLAQSRLRAKVAILSGLWPVLFHQTTKPQTHSAADTQLSWDWPKQSQAPGNRHWRHYLRNAEKPWFRAGAEFAGGAGGLFSTDMDATAETLPGE